MPEPRDTLVALADRGEPAGADVLIDRLERELGGPRTGGWVAGPAGVGVVRFGVAFALVVLIGLVVVLLGPGRDVPVPPVDPNPATTAPTEPVSTTIRLPDGAESSGPIVVEGLSEELGAFEWITLTAEGEASFPVQGGVRVRPDGGFVADPGDGRVWTSSDGLVWSSEAGPGVDQLEGFDSVRVLGDHARVETFDEASGMQTTGLLRWDGDGWEPVELPAVDTPGDGVDARHSYDQMEVSGSSVLVTAGVDGTIPWDAVPGATFSFEAYRAGELALEGDAGLVPLSVVAEGTEVVVRVADTGDTFHRVDLGSVEAAERWAAEPTCLLSMCSLATGAWVAVDGRPFEEIDIPGGGREIAGIGGGAFAYVHPDTGEVLVTSDGVWEPVGFVFEGLAACGGELGTDYVDFDELEQGFVVSFACNGSAEEVWTSPDGLMWSPGTQLGSRASFGEVRTVEADGSRSFEIEVSVEDDTWVRLPLPADFPPEAGFSGSGEDGYSVAGDTVFRTHVETPEDGPTRAWMWVGRFLGSP